MTQREKKGGPIKVNFQMEKDRQSTGALVNAWMANLIECNV